jgi:hypothetical protein
MPVPDFSPGEVLTAAAMDSIGLWLVKTQTIGTGVSSVAVTSAFSSTYDNYLIVIDTQSSANSNLRMKLRNGATDKSANYFTGAFYFDMVGGGALNGEGSGGAVTTGFRIGAMNSAGIFTTFIQIGRPFTTTRTTVQVQPQATESYFRLMSGYHNENYSADGINVIPDSGTLTGGTIRVYGYRN